MNTNLSKMVKQLENNYDELIFNSENYKAMARLFYYGTKYEWVRNKIEQADLNIDFKSTVTKEEIQDYISHIKSIENRKRMKKILNKLNDDNDKAFLLDMLLKNKEV